MHLPLQVASAGLLDLACTDDGYRRKFEECCAKLFVNYD